MTVKRRDFQKAAALVHEFLLKLSDDSECAELRDALNLALLHMQRYYRHLRTRMQSQEKVNGGSVLSQSLNYRGMSPMTPFKDTPDKFQWKWINLENGKLKTLPSDLNQDLTTLPFIIQAAKEGDNNTLMQLIEKDPDCIFDLDCLGRNALMYAVHFGHLDTVSILLENGIDVNATAQDGSSACHRACHDGNSEALQILSEYQADLSLQDLQGRAPVHWSCASRDRECLRLLIEKAVSTTTADREGMTPSMWACRMDNISHFELLMSKDNPDGQDDPYEHDSSGKTWMHWSVRRTDPLECLKTLLTEDSANLKDDDGKTVVLTAADQGSLPAVKIILEIAGAECLEHRDKHNRTPLILATIGGHGELVNFLLAEGADLAQVDDFGVTAWDYARARQLHYCMLIIASYIRQRAREDSENGEFQSKFKDQDGLLSTDKVEEGFGINNLDISNGDTQGADLYRGNKPYPSPHPPSHPPTPRTPRAPPTRTPRPKTPATPRGRPAKHADAHVNGYGSHTPRAPPTPRGHGGVKRSPSTPEAEDDMFFEKHDRESSAGSSSKRMRGENDSPERDTMMMSVMSVDSNDHIMPESRHQSAVGARHPPPSVVTQRLAETGEMEAEMVNQSQYIEGANHEDDEASVSIDAMDVSDFDGDAEGDDEGENLPSDRPLQNHSQGNGHPTGVRGKNPKAQSHPKPRPHSEHQESYQSNHSHNQASMSWKQHSSRQQPSPSPRLPVTTNHMYNRQPHPPQHHTAPPSQARFVHDDYIEDSHDHPEQMLDESPRESPPPPSPAHPQPAPRGQPPPFTPNLPPETAKRLPPMMTPLMPIVKKRKTKKKLSAQSPSSSVGLQGKSPLTNKDVNYIDGSGEHTTVNSQPPIIHVAPNSARGKLDLRKTLQPSSDIPIPHSKLLQSSVVQPASHKTVNQSLSCEEQCSSLAKTQKQLQHLPHSSLTLEKRSTGNQKSIDTQSSALQDPTYTASHSKLSLGVAGDNKLLPKVIGSKIVQSTGLPNLHGDKKSQQKQGIIDISQSDHITGKTDILNHGHKKSLDCNTKVPYCDQKYSQPHEEHSVVEGMVGKRLLPPSQPSSHPPSPQHDDVEMQEIGTARTTTPASSPTPRLGLLQKSDGRVLPPAHLQPLPQSSNKRKKKKKKRDMQGYPVEAYRSHEGDAPPPVHSYVAPIPPPMHHHPPSPQPRERSPPHDGGREAGMGVGPPPPDAIAHFPGWGKGGRSSAKPQPKKRGQSPASGDSWVTTYSTASMDFHHPKASNTFSTGKPTVPMIPCTPSLFRNNTGKAPSPRTPLLPPATRSSASAKPTSHQTKSDIQPNTPPIKNDNRYSDAVNDGYEDYDSNTIRSPPRSPRSRSLPPNNGHMQSAGYRASPPRFQAGGQMGSGPDRRPQPQGSAESRPTQSAVARGRPPVPQNHPPSPRSRRPGSGKTGNTPPWTKKKVPNGRLPPQVN